MLKIQFCSRPNRLQVTVPTLPHRRVGLALDRARPGARGARLVRPGAESAGACPSTASAPRHWIGLGGRRVADRPVAARAARGGAGARAGVVQRPPAFGMKKLVETVVRRLADASRPGPGLRDLRRQDRRVRGSRSPRRSAGGSSAGRAARSGRCARSSAAAGIPRAASAVSGSASGTERTGAYARIQGSRRFIGSG